MTYDLDHQDIRDGIARLCQDFAGDYWQACDKDYDASTHQPL